MFIRTSQSRNIYIIYNSHLRFNQDVGTGRTVHRKWGLQNHNIYNSHFIFNQDAGTGRTGSDGANWILSIRRCILDPFDQTARILDPLLDLFDQTVCLLDPSLDLSIRRCILDLFDQRRRPRRAIYNKSIGVMAPKAVSRIAINEDNVCLRCPTGSLKWSRGGDPQHQDQKVEKASHKISLEIPNSPLIHNNSITIRAREFKNEVKFQCRFSARASCRSSPWWTPRWTTEEGPGTCRVSSSFRFVIP
jgi:hypothetical protein